MAVAGNQFKISAPGMLHKKGGGELMDVMARGGKAHTSTPLARGLLGSSVGKPVGETPTGARETHAIAGASF
jgi:hypothetical protein